MPLAAEFHIDGVRVPAEIIVGFKERDLVLLAQPIGGGQAGNPGSNNGDSHGGGV